MFGRQFNKVAEELMKYHDWVLEFCKCFNIKYIDFYTEFKKEAGPNFKNLFLDGLHPNDEGHEIMAEIFSRHISGLNNSKKENEH